MFSCVSCESMDEPVIYHPAPVPCTNPSTVGEINQLIKAFWPGPYHSIPTWKQGLNHINLVLHFRHLVTLTDYFLCVRTDAPREISVVYLNCCACQTFLPVAMPLGHYLTCPFLFYRLENQHSGRGAYPRHTWRTANMTFLSKGGGRD